LQQAADPVHGNPAGEQAQAPEVQVRLQQSVATWQVPPVNWQTQASAAHAPLQHSELEKQPPLGRQHPPSKQDCVPVHWAIEVQPCTGGVQKPP
jgi:hypothetical protein